MVVVRRSEEEVKKEDVSEEWEGEEGAPVCFNGQPLSRKKRS